MCKLFFRALTFATLLLLICAVDCRAQSFLARELKINGIFASRSDNSITYFFLGCGWLRTLSSRDEKTFIEKWLVAHPNAKATPISAMTVARRGQRTRERWVYVWLEDGTEIMNVALIKEGVFPGGVMLDMVEAEQRLMQELNDSTLANVRVQIEKERSSRSVGERPVRLVADKDYADRMKRIAAAEDEARGAKKGIWSDGMKEERDAEGYK